uniref:Conserved secreted protein n=1 Tax=Panagrellus redivivus TaxID=6233 RepID=A0A7E4VBT8_PANRE
MYSKILFLGFCVAVLAAPTPPPTGSGSGHVVTAKIDDNLYAIVEIPEVVNKTEAVPAASKTSNLAVPLLRKARAVQPTAEPLVTGSGSGKVVTVNINDDLAGIVEINGEESKTN